MKKKIFYWAPCLNKVGTVISTKNSAISLAKYKKNLYDITILNVFGEWDDHIEELKKNNINVQNLSFNFYKLLPKTGYLKSRLSYIIIILISFFPLLICLKKQKPNFLILHLITSLPLFLASIFKFNTKFILRISGMPKLNYLRKNFWRRSSKFLFKITCPTYELLEKLKKQSIFQNEKLDYLQDAIINTDYSKPENIKINKITSRKVILTVGRLTTQKNHKYLIEEFNNFLKTSDEYDLLILGDGEEKKKLEKLILKLKLVNRVHLLGRVENVYDYMKKSEVFVLSSLWEEMGFVIIEAAYNNLFVITSDCPNGPKEFIGKNERGILFESNKKNSLGYALREFLNKKNKFNIKVKAKIKSHKYTKFRHHKKLIEIIENENTA